VGHLYGVRCQADWVEMGGVTVSLFQKVGYKIRLVCMMKGGDREVELVGQLCTLFSDSNRSPAGDSLTLTMLSRSTAS
jgi:hypothetical protein